MEVLGLGQSDCEAYIPLHYVYPGGHHPYYLYVSVCLHFHSAMIWWNVWSRNEARVTVRLIFHWPLTRPGIIITMTTHNYPEITNRKPPGQCFTHSNKTMSFWVIFRWSLHNKIPCRHKLHIFYRFEYPQVSLLSALWVYLVSLKLILNLYPKLIRLITLYWLGITEGGDHHSLPPPQCY